MELRGWPVSLRPRRRRNRGETARYRFLLRGEQEPGVATKTVESRLHSGESSSGLDCLRALFRDMSTPTRRCRATEAKPEHLKTSLLEPRQAVCSFQGTKFGFAELTPCRRVLACGSTCRDCVTNSSLRLGPKARSRKSERDKQA